MYEIAELRRQVKLLKAEIEKYEAVITELRKRMETYRQCIDEELERLTGHGDSQ